MTDSLITEAINNTNAPAQPVDDQEMKEQLSKPVDYLGGMFAYQINLLVQHYGKQATALLEKQLSKNVEQNYTKVIRRKEQ